MTIPAINPSILVKAREKNSPVKKLMPAYGRVRPDEKCWIAADFINLAADVVQVVGAIAVDAELRGAKDAWLQNVSAEHILTVTPGDPILDLTLSVTNDGAAPWVVTGPFWIAMWSSTLNTISLPFYGPNPIQAAHSFMEVLPTPLTIAPGATVVNNLQMNLPPEGAYFAAALYASQGPSDYRFPWFQYILTDTWILLDGSDVTISLNVVSE